MLLERLVERLLTNKTEILRTLGLPMEPFANCKEISNLAETKLHQFAAILDAVTLILGSSIKAYAWFRSEPLPGFAGRTPGQVFRDNEAEGLLKHVERVLEAGYA